MNGSIQMSIRYPDRKIVHVIIHSSMTGFFLLLFLILAIPPCSAMDAPWEWNTEKAPAGQDMESIETGVPGLVAKAAIGFFQNRISPADGPRCKFYPSCSEYCKTAINRHGFILGSIMFADRFMRDHGWVSDDYPVVWINGQQLYFDPLYMNDFWWFDPDEYHIRMVP